jgi:hypothetical protein
MPYTITMPGKLYQGLAGRDAFHNDNPTDQACLAIFKAAEVIEMTNGVRYVITGDKQVVDEILLYLHSLLGLVEHGLLPVSELGVPRKLLEKTAKQTPQEVDK